MIYLLAALLFSTLVFLLFKVFERYGVQVLPAIMVNYVFAAALSYLFSGSAVSLLAMPFEPWAWIAVVAGISFVLTFVTFGIGMQRNGAAATVVSSKMSIVLTATAGFLLFGEAFNALKITGILTAAAALVLTNLKKEGLHVDRRYAVLPLAVFAGTAVNDTFMKLSSVRFPALDNLTFLTLTFATAFVVSSLVCLWMVLAGKLKITRRDVLGGVVLSTVNWLSSVYFIKGISMMPISLFVPVFNSALVAVAAITAYFLFKERITRTNLAGIVLALISILLIAIV